jgi:exonuclease SbcD
MRILHTSDWHIGRSFHGHSTTAHLEQVLDALVAVVIDQQVDVVVVAGDVFDSATPAAENFDVLTRALAKLRATGTRVVMTSGNHDSATRLGFQSGFAELAGIHIITRHEQAITPVTIADEHGPVHFYGIPYLEPSMLRHRYPDATLRTHTDALAFTMDSIRADLASRGGRSVVISHCFAADVADVSSDLAQDSGERDITAGGLDVVPLSTFDGPDYVALGHIHGRARLSDRARYSGAPLHYSFSEAAKPRGGWLVSLDATGLPSVEWVDLPVPRRLTVLTGELESLLADAAYSGHEHDWIAAILTDRVRPMDGMRRLQARFPFAAMLEHRPSIVADAGPTSYGERIKAKSDSEIVDGFLEFVRNGVGPTDAERRLIADAISAQAATEVSS